MDSCVKVHGCTVIKVRCRPKDEKGIQNWWIKLCCDRRRANAVEVSGLPAYINEEHLRKVFQVCGAIQFVQIKPTDQKFDSSHLPKFYFTVGSQKAYVHFTSKSGQEAALTMKFDENYTLCIGDEKIQPMTKVWLEDLRRSYDVNTEKLFNSCTEYMQKFDSEKVQQEKKNRKLAEVPDDEGWVTVTRTKFSKPPKALKAHELRKLKKFKETKTLLHFYKNQVNDSKMQRIKELKAKFEEDKKRIQELKQKRKFKPY